MPKVKKNDPEEDEDEDETVASEKDTVAVSDDMSSGTKNPNPAPASSTNTPFVDQNVKVIELNGRMYNEIFNPIDGTTTRVPLNPIE